MAAHFQNQHRDAQSETDPEAAGHVEKFRVRAGIGRDRLGLQRHSADGTGARADLPDLRMHWAGVDGPGRDLRRLLFPASDVGRW